MTPRGVRVAAVKTACVLVYFVVAGSGCAAIAAIPSLSGWSAIGALVLGASLFIAGLWTWVGAIDEMHV